MAVKDDYSLTEDLILSHPRRHFRTSVSPNHWQLRAQVGTEKNDAVYFPNGNGNTHVQKLNTSTHEVETIRILPFKPRCLVAKNGWIGCGGENGEFSIFRATTEGGDSDDHNLHPPTLDPDARLPLDFNSIRPEDSLFSALSRARQEKNIVAKSKTYGKERVNCITLWFPPKYGPEEGGYREPVAVLANNDKSISVVALRDQVQLDEVRLPDCVNRGVISPDGSLMVAICDDPFLYVYTRVKKASSGLHSLRTSDAAAYEWRPCRSYHLSDQSKEDKTNNRGSFAVCFSPSGKYLAVGTQYGSITVFDVSCLTDLDVDPALSIFSSSRPNSDFGAVRDMAFSPGPFELLAWTEDRGRVGIADVRNNFASRQMLQLDKADAYEHLDVSDRTTIDPRLLEDRSDRRDNLSSTLASSLDLSADARPPRRSNGLEPLGRYHSPLTSDETMVLEALQEHRRRREQRQAALAASGPRLLPWAGERGMVRSPLSTDASSRTRERSGSVTRAVNDILGTIRDQRDRLRETQDRLRAMESIDAARRRILENRQNREARAAENAAAGADSAPQSTLRRLRPGSAAPGGPTDATEATAFDAIPQIVDEWHDLEMLYNMSTAQDGYGATSSTAAAPAAAPAPTAAAPTGQADIDRRRRLRLSAALREWDDRPSVRALAGYMGEDPHPQNTGGMAWSENGQTLYVGAQDGIYEFKVNVVARKFYPSITAR